MTERMAVCKGRYQLDLLFLGQELRFCWSLARMNTSTPRHCFEELQELVDVADQRLTWAMDGAEDGRERIHNDCD